MKLLYIILSTWPQSWKYTLQSYIYNHRKETKVFEQVVADLGDQEESLSLFVSLQGRISTAFTLLTFLQDSQINPSWQHGKSIRTTNKPCSGMDRINRSALVAIRWGTTLILIKHGFGWLRTLCLKITYITSYWNNAFNPWLGNFI